MAQDISFIGCAITIKDSVLFPNRGFVLEAFADDQAPIDVPDSTLAEVGMGANGHMLIWRVPSVKEFTVALAPESEDAKNMRLIANAGQVGRGVTATSGILSASIVWPSGTIVNYSGGVIRTGPLSPKATTGGRLASEVFNLVFETVTSNL